MDAADRHVTRVAERSQAALDLSLRAVWLQTRFYGRLNAAEHVGTGAILATGFLLVRAGDGGRAVLVRLSDPLNTALGLIDDVQSAGASLARLVGVAQLPEHPGRPVRYAQTARRSTVVWRRRPAQRGRTELRSDDAHLGVPSAGARHVRRERQHDERG